MGECDGDRDEALDDGGEGVRDDRDDAGVFDRDDAARAGEGSAEGAEERSSCFTRGPSR